ncbi:cell division protein FtsA [Ignavibacteria bacterium]
MQTLNDTYTELDGGDIVVGLDIGTSKVCCLVASIDDARKKVNVLGIGEAPNEGLRRGVVVNIDKTVRSIQQAVEQASSQSGIAIREVVVGIAGDHIDSFRNRSIITIPDTSREISSTDVDRLIEEAQKILLPSDRKIIHIIPQDYIIDGQDGVIDPIGMSGVRMEANIHIVTALATAVQNIYRCVERCGLKVADVVLEPLANSYAVLDNDEKEVGVALIDIGGGTTDIAVFQHNIIRHTSVIGIAGHEVTEDICSVLGILKESAEKVKREFGYAMQTGMMRDEVFMIPGVGGRKPIEVSKSLLCQIIQPRMEEIFEFAYSELKRSGYADRLSAGIVLTGGSSLLRGSEELAQIVFGMPVKIGIPTGDTYGGLAQEIENPKYATAIGLVLYGLEHRKRKFENSTDVKTPSVTEEKESTESENRKSSIFKKIKNFFEEL